MKYSAIALAAVGFNVKLWYASPGAWLPGCGWLSGKRVSRVVPCVVLVADAASAVLAAVDLVKHAAVLAPA